MPALAALMELLAVRRILAEVARIYLGAEPARRVLSGDVQRGDVTVIRSAIMFADMRSFTDISMQLTAKQTVDLLNHYYDCVVPPVESRGGEVLKFIADGVLAIFQAGDDDAEDAARLAWAASLEALERVAALNVAGTAPSRFAVGIGLHFGDVGYGNVGSGERQDYTVIGSDVNIASRVAGMCGSLVRPLVFSGAFAELVENGLVVEIGRFPLKGVRGETPIFAPAR
jgi:adenylate cyclase